MGPFIPHNLGNGQFGFLFSFQGGRAGGMVFLLFSTLSHDDKDRKPIAFIPYVSGSPAEMICPPVQEDLDLRRAIVRKSHPRINKSPPRGVRIPRLIGTGVPADISAEIM